MEREVLLTGIGGQGVQLAARTLAVAAVKEGLEAMLFGEYGGMMRGGNTDATVVVADGPLLAPPTVDRASGAIVLHHDYWPGVRARLRDDAVVVIDSSVFRGEVSLPSTARLIRLDASQLALESGNVKGASMIALGAFVGATTLVSLDSLVAAAHEVLPPYRAQHAERNAESLRVGYAKGREPAEVGS